MKKKILLTIALITIIFIPCVKAEGTMKVIFNTSFEEQIDINKIEDIYVMMDDINIKGYNLVLKHKDNFYLELNNVPVGDIKITSITVSRDYTVDYEYETNITKTSEEETVVSILVKKVNKDPNRKKANVTYEYIAEVLGYDPLKITSSTSNNTNTTTNNSSSTTSEPINNDEPIVITSSSSTTTTQSEYELKEIEEAKKEEEKKEEQAKRKSIYLLILLCIIAAIIIIGIIIGIKIANANK